MSKRTVYRLISFIIALIGIAIISSFDGIYDAAGVILMLWSNNIDQELKK